MSESKANDEPIDLATGQFEDTEVDPADPGHRAEKRSTRQAEGQIHYRTTMWDISEEIAKAEQSPADASRGPMFGTSTSAQYLLCRYMYGRYRDRLLPLPKARERTIPAGEQTRQIAPMPRFRSKWAMFHWLPVPIRAQAIFAEALSQAIAAGLPVRQAVAKAAEVAPGPRFRSALRELAGFCGVGLSLEDALRRTGIRVSPKLFIALEIGEARGRLSEQLRLFARRYRRLPEHDLAMRICPFHAYELRRFSQILEELLRDNRLTVKLLEKAAEGTAGRKSKFTDAIRGVAEDMRDGRAFGEALRRCPALFHPFYYGLIESSAARPELRATLKRFAGEL